MRLRIPPPGANRPESKLLMWVGHYAVWFVLASLPVVAYDDWTHYATNGFLSSLLNLPISIAICAIASDVLEHRWRLCERCARHTPLDGAQAAQRWRWALWLTHSKVMIFGLGIMPALLAWRTIQGQSMPWIYWLADWLFFVFVAVNFAAVRKHHALYAWCPRCDWGGGGKKEPSPEVPSVPSPDLVGS